LHQKKKKKKIAFSERESGRRSGAADMLSSNPYSHDRGTLFGLNKWENGKYFNEPRRHGAKWVYNYQPEPGCKEAELLDYLNHMVIG